MIKPLQYYFKDGSHIEFKKYTIDTSGVVRIAETGGVLFMRKKGYNSVNVVDDVGKTREIKIGCIISNVEINHSFVERTDKRYMSLFV